MAMSTPISRLAAYYTRHGFGATIRRAALAVQRDLFPNRMVVFYCDLTKQNLVPANIPSSLKVECLINYADLSSQDLQEMISFWNPEQAHQNIRERFEQRASLWLIRSGDSLAGYSWTIRGRTIAAYYFPMAQDDVQLFDFYVFPKFRGRAILWFLVTHILRSLGDEGAARVFGDVAEWNRASLSFYKTIPFNRLGVVRSLTLFGHTFLSWGAHEPVRQIQPTSGKVSRPVTNRSTSHEKA
jgi:hypothetical protein